MGPGPGAAGGEGEERATGVEVVRIRERLTRERAPRAVPAAALLRGVAGEKMSCKGEVNWKSRGAAWDGGVRR